MDMLLILLVFFKGGTQTLAIFYLIESKREDFLSIFRECLVDGGCEDNVELSINIVLLLLQLVNKLLHFICY
jgi:hypothetical protein